MNELALFAGAGGGILGGHLLGWTITCAVEYNAYARSILLARQNDGTLPPFPIWDDVRTFDGNPWRGRIDVISGGFPCQDISAAGKGTGINGERSGLWSEMARIIREVRPSFVVVENSPMLTGRGLGKVLGDLAEMGFNAEWGVVSAADTGAPHLRERIWIVAYSMRVRYSGSESIELSTHNSKRAPETYRQIRREVSDAAKPISQDVADPNSLRKLQPERHEQNIGGRASNSCKEMANSSCINEQGIIEIRINKKERSRSVERQVRSFSNEVRRWPTEPRLGRVAHGVAHRVDRLKAIGNGQVPIVEATAFNLLNVSSEDDTSNL